MKYRYAAAGFSAFLLLCMFSGCGETSAPDTADTQETSAFITAPVTTAAETETTVTETEPQRVDTLSYMERHADLLEEIVPEEILVQREGVTYPQFEKYYYYSQTAERDTGVNVLLPADYSAEREYPVLYVLHGSADTEDWMVRDEIGISTMLTNLVTDGLAKEMIVVSPYIYCSKDMPYCTGLDEQNFRNFDNFLNDMMTDLKPFIEETFSVARGREHTAITGFSLGGRESFYIGFTHPEAFGFIGSICPASGVVEGTGNPPALTAEQFCFTEIQPELLLLSAAEQDAAVGEIPFNYHRILTENNTEHLWHLMTDSGHEMRSVTSHLYQFLRMIFLDT